MLWYVLLGSQVVYLTVPHAAELGGPGPNEGFVRTFALVLAGISVITAAGTLVYRRRALVEPIQAGRLDPDSPEGTAHAFTPYILNLVFTESIAIYGLVLALVSRSPLAALPFAVGAFVLMWVHRPTAPDLSPPAKAGVYRPPSL
jgi:F0F1-type ATP synthase membrane subunit c/vacuolar-type H+-ATPase subunit K